MNPTKALNNLGQSLWLDNITRDLLNSGTLQRYINEWSVTGLTSNPTIFDLAISKSADYDGDIAKLAPRAKAAEDTFFELALADLTRAADLLQPVFTRTDGVDGWVSLEVSPLLAYDTQRTIAAARDLNQRAGKPNLFIKIPGTKEGCRRLRKRSLPACRSTSRCCSRASNMSPRRKRICAGSNGASTPASTPPSVRSPRSS